MTLEIGLIADGGTVTATAVPKSPRRPLPVVVVELVGEPARYFSDTAYRDLAAGVTCEVRLANVISYERIISTVFWGNGRSRSGLGAIELINTDGALDALLLSAPRERVVNVYLGDDETAWGDLVQVARVRVARPESVGEQRLRFLVLDGAANLARTTHGQAKYSTGPLAGQYLPFLLGKCHSIPARHSDPPNSLFSIDDHDSGFTIDGVRDSGVALTVTTQWVRHSSGQHHGIELQQASVGRVVIDATCGTAPGSSYAADSAPGFVEWLISHRSSFGGTVDYTALEAITGSFGYWVGQPTRVDQILDEFVASFGGWWFVDLDETLRFGRMELPAGDPVLEITGANLVGEVAVQLDIAPGLTDTVRSQRNWHVYSPSELATSIRDTDTGVALQQEYRVSGDFDVHAVYAEARAAQRPAAATLLQDSSLATELAAREAFWDEGPWWWFRVSVELDALQAATLRQGDVARLTLPADCYRVIDGAYTAVPRFNLGAGHLVRIIEVRGELGEGRVDLLLHGATPEAELEGKK